MDYQWHYDRLIETRKNRKLETNFETHHIIPKSLGGTNDRENLINLTPREHFLAHWLLWKIHKNRQMSFAFFSMCQYRKGKRKEFKISSRAYEEARLSRTVTGISEETRMKMSLAKKGKKASPETRMKISLVQLGKEPWNKGKKGVSEATRQRMIKKAQKTRLDLEFFRKILESDVELSVIQEKIATLYLSGKNANEIISILNINSYEIYNSIRSMKSKLKKL